MFDGSAKEIPVEDSVKPQPCSGLTVMNSMGRARDLNCRLTIDSQERSPSAAIPRVETIRESTPPNSVSSLENNSTSQRDLLWKGCGQMTCTCNNSLDEVSAKPISRFTPLQQRTRS